MKTEKGVVIIAYKPGRSPRFAVLNRKKNWEGWELPKGHLENDDYEETVRLEMEEEAGIGEEHLKEIEGTDEVLEWSFEREGEEIKREYKCFLVKVADKAIIDVEGNPHDEHDSGFFLNREDTEGLLTHDNQVELLEKVTEQLD
ncbi:MAG: NUDIX domain-containing protein [Nanohaloarchaea archaeon]|nr:NUDIX domain-containing protein [Candidatus Nanohaloarchaea archaeon]